MTYTIDIIGEMIGLVLGVLETCMDDLLHFWALLKLSGEMQDGEQIAHGGNGLMAIVRSKASTERLQPQFHPLQVAVYRSDGWGVETE
ncbi:hypothetical protein NOR51B_2062 [Luminiphilus syltensis NOR5-1B]|uniref:Uncharacterized protein n=1 Tax=Luminiphilus syltensis NOR5-1B TaxID=565045 RepID=B8KRL8_9GAMM|nr:hypothetical protein NOR51B_2062 [Luminiphilus syltensis NOR5-1B]